MTEETETRALAGQLRGEVSTYENVGLAAHERSGNLRRSWMQNFEGNHDYGSVGQKEGSEAYKGRIQSMYRQADLKTLLTPSRSEQARNQVRGRLDKQYDKLHKDEEAFEIATNEYRRHGMRDRMSFDEINGAGTGIGTFDQIEHSIHGSLASRMASLAAGNPLHSQHLLRVGKSPSAVQGTQLQAPAMRSAAGRMATDAALEAHIQNAAFYGGAYGGAAAYSTAAYPSNASANLLAEAATVETQAKLRGLSAEMQQLHRLRVSAASAGPWSAGITGAVPPPQDMNMAQHLLQPYDDHFYRFSPRDAARLIDEVHRLKGECAAGATDDLEIRYHPYPYGAAIGNASGSISAADFGSVEEALKEHRNLPRRVELSANPGSSASGASTGQTTAFSVATDSVMWKTPVGGSINTFDKGQILGSLDSAEASPSMKLEIARSLNHEPRRSVELVSKLPIDKDRKVDILCDDVLRHIPMSASKKVELLRSVPLVPTNTRVENWKNEILTQLPVNRDSTC